MDLRAAQRPKLEGWVARCREDWFSRIDLRPANPHDQELRRPRSGFEGVLETKPRVAPAHFQGLRSLLEATCAHTANSRLVAANSLILGATPKLAYDPVDKQPSLATLPSARSRGSNPRP